MNRDAIDSGRKGGVTSDEHKELVELRRRNRELAADGIPVAVACRFLNVSTSGYYEWASRPPSPRAIADATLTTTIRRIHSASRATYGAPRVLAELRLGLGVHVGRKRVARLMRVGVSHRRKRRGWKPDTATHEDLVKRQFRADAPNRLWFCDITQHRARDGWVYCAAVIDAFSRRIVRWSISDRITAEIVVDALEMARWRRRPEPGTVVHADRGLKDATRVGDVRVDRGLLQPSRRHSALDYFSPADYEALHDTIEIAA
ncbi:hypothetical protein LUZ63_023714 [Rhynchospora breviuscula]|uniref:Integrase catalytic domain-containing protein n=1 Tax=Rhynchospora breviuscula TaxID=2022672 RepID=A0A9Q0BWM0_9POAL|nr:hypothetical protein LUZ63_023714 [Rhynchospora breviuscula]